MLPHQIGPVRLDHLGPYQQTERSEDPADDARHRRLAGAGRPGEYEVPGRRLTGQTLAVPEPGHLQLRDDLVHLALDRLKPDKRVSSASALVDGRGVG